MECPVQEYLFNSLWDWIVWLQAHQGVKGELIYHKRFRKNNFKQFFLIQWCISMFLGFLHFKVQVVKTRALFTPWQMYWAHVVIVVFYWSCPHVVIVVFYWSCSHVVIVVFYWSCPHVVIVVFYWSKCPVISSDQLSTRSVTKKQV